MDDEIQNRCETDSGVFGALKAMTGFFTVAGVNVTEDDIRSMESRFWLAPVIGSVIGLLVTAICIILYQLNYWNMSVAVIAIAVAYIISKFLHFDGLVDMGDGLIATGNTEKRIRALKDTAIGAGGVGAALIVILLSITSYAGMGLMLMMFVWPVEISIKNAMVSAAAFGKPGSGMASNQVRATSVYSAAISSVLTFVLSFAVMAVTSVVLNALNVEAFSRFGISDMLIMSFGATVASLIIGYITAYIGNKTFGFVNGDVLGATNEIARAVVAIVMMLIYTNMWF